MGPENYLLMGLLLGFLAAVGGKTIDKRIVNEIHIRREVRRVIGEVERIGAER